MAEKNNENNASSPQAKNQNSGNSANKGRDGQNKNRQNSSGTNNHKKNRNKNKRNRNKRNYQKNDSGSNNANDNNSNNSNTSNNNSSKKSRKNKNYKRKRRKGGKNKKRRNDNNTITLVKTRKKHEKLINIQNEVDKESLRFKDELKKLKEPEGTCEICREAIDDALTAVLAADGNGICHFDCVLNELKDEEKLEENEEIVYMGNGDFGVIQHRNNRGKEYIFMRKRIHYSNKQRNVVAATSENTLSSDEETDD